MPPFPRSLTTSLLDRQLGEAYQGFSSAQRTRHVKLLREMAGSEDVALHHQATETGRWQVTIAAPDAVGVLAVITGLFTIYHMDIISAKVFSLVVPQEPIRFKTRPPRTPPPLPCALDIFEVQPLGLSSPDWAGFRRDLNELITKTADEGASAALDRVVERFGAAISGASTAAAALTPVEVVVDNPAGSDHTRLELRSADVPGFLFAFTNALAGSTVDIRRASVATVNGQARDVFWVTGQDGGRLIDPDRIQELRVAAVLVKQFTYLLPRSPDPAQALRQFRGLLGQVLANPERARDLSNLQSPDVLETLAGLMGVSRFLWEDFLRLQHENLYPVVVDLPGLSAPVAKATLAEALDAGLSDIGPISERVVELNRFKDREMFRIDLRHITGRMSFRHFSEELSDLAEVIVAAAAQLALEAAGDTAPAGALKAVPWSIAALGKFGGRELGFGSDIELIFVYDGTPTSRDDGLHQCFEEVVRTFESNIHARQHGVFEIDLRLRPHGSAGALAVPLGAFRSYYSAGGDAQPFERLALVKLRPVAGDSALGATLVAVRDAWVYSALPVDLEDMRDLRQRQVDELVAPGEVNAKYSPGGLVDVEYFVQSQQIRWGHSNPRVRTTNTLDAIASLAAGNALDSGRAERLTACYSFLRQLIDALRVVRGNSKDLNIPAIGSNEFSYLAQRLQLNSTDALEAAIAARMSEAASVWTW